MTAQEPSLVRWFPNLARTWYEITSPRTPDYNCIAWAAGDTERWWWPSPDAYWPRSLSRVETLESFLEAFQQLGYEPTSRVEREAGYERVAIYVKAGVPIHMARQLPSGEWTSKLRTLEDITHETLEGVAGESYGTVALVLRRPRAK